jgi:hypothetical protein
VARVILVHQGSGLAQENYEEAVRQLSGKSRLESAADWPVEGLLVHAAGQGAGGFRVVDVWESEDAARRFGETLMPILQEVASKRNRRSIPRIRSSRREVEETDRCANQPSVSAPPLCVE